MKFLVITSMAAIFQQVNAHGYLSQPAAAFQGGSVATSYNAILTESSDPAFAGLKWDDSPETNTATFTNAFPNSKYNTLRDLLDTAAPTCGNTLTTGSPVDVSSLNSMKWQNDQEMKGFIESHHGPCEAWIDSNTGTKTRVFRSDDCRRDYTGYPAEIPIDYSLCTGECTFVFYWLAMHEANWQVYKQCAPIVNGPATESTTVLGTVTPPTTTAASTATETINATNSPVLAMTALYDPATVAPENTIFVARASCKRRKLRRLTANLRSES
ncbi:hypothetical protein PRIC1_000051 [Phytophthora ramorum]